MNHPTYASGLSVLISIVIAISLLSLCEFSAVAPTPRHCKGLEVLFYEDQNQAFNALMTGEVDLTHQSLSDGQYKTVIEDSFLLLAGYPGRGTYQLDINNNYTIPEYPGVRSPTSEICFRRAIAHMIDKDWIIDEVLEGLGERIDAHLGAATMGYANRSVIGTNYPYPHNLDRAADLLDACFADTDDDGTRNYPPGWPGRETGPNLDPVKVVIRTDHEPRMKVGYALTGNMSALGVPVMIVDHFHPYYNPVYELDYHIYTGAWSLSRIPFYLYGLYHSDNWLEHGSNYVTGMNSSNLPNYPALDRILEKLYFATSLEEFKEAADEATYLLVDNCVSIPLWSRKYYHAYSRCLAGLVNSPYSIDNPYTFLNMRKLDDLGTPQDESQEPIRMGTHGIPHKINPVYSMWYYDFAVLDRIFDYKIWANPLDVSVEQPWIAQDHEVSMWFDPQSLENKTKVTYWIRQDVFWHAPVTGEAVRQFTAHDVEFTIWYNYAYDGWWWTNVKGVHHTRIIDEFTIEVYFDSLGIAPFFSFNVPVLPKYEYLDLLCKQVCVPLEITVGVAASDKMMLDTTDQVIQMVNATKYPEDIPLIEGIDYEVFTVGDPNYTHTEVHWLRSLDPGETVEFCYWTSDLDPDGYYLGGFDWNQTLYSLGPYYPVEIVPGIGGYAILNCSPSHFLGAPALGEIDWRWSWQGTAKPRSGYYKVDLYDAVALLKAYGSIGYGEVDPDWCPNADLDSYDVGHIGLYDAVILLVSYGKKHGEPPGP